jgi:hypothetical protein
MASNSSVLQDDDNDFSDWIEIYNRGSAAVNLLNWSLTDDAQNPSKWRFPSTNIGPREFMVVFASGKNRRAPGRALHTNFRLEAAGEYLAMVGPDGRVATEYHPGFPPQIPDISYGTGSTSPVIQIVPSAAEMRVHIPGSSGIGLEWTSVGFDDTNWLEGRTGAGFETGLEDPAERTFEFAVLQSRPGGYWRFSESSGRLARNAGTFGSGADGSYMNEVVLGAAGPRPPQFDLFEPENSAARFGAESSVTTPKSLLDSKQAFTIAGWIRPTSSQAHRTGLFGQNDAIEFGFIDPNTIQLWTPNGGSLDVPYPFALNEWHFLTATGDGQKLRIYFDGILAGTGGSPTFDYGSSQFPFNIGGGGIFDQSGNQFTGEIDEVALWDRALTETEISALLAGGGVSLPGFGELIKTDLQRVMHGTASSAFIRIPFTLEDPSGVDQLILRMKFDDGFVAYLNGQEIARRNAPEPAQWDSTATAAQPRSQALIFEEIDISNYSHFLIAGGNLLAIHGLNISPTDGDFLILPELAVRSNDITETIPRYFRLPTPGASNGAGAADLGPVISLIQHSPAVPNQGEDLLVAAGVFPAFHPVASVTLRYRIMFGPATDLQMADDGMNGDEKANDGVYSVKIPSNSAGPGQMIRYYVEASDAGGYSSRWPLFEHPIDSAEYLGTVVADPRIESELPVVQLFAANPGAASTFSGTRCSLYYLGEFYDNIEINLHGQSSSGFPKKSYDLDFNKDHRFRYRPGSPRVKDVKLLSNWADKAKVRNALAYDMIQEAGSGGHFCFQVRVELNGAFFSIADLMEDADERWLERLGRDPNGALYKVYDSLASASGGEKKTRRFENRSDLESFITNLSESRPMSSRVAYAYDNIDLPQTISYFAALALISSQDHGHKNFFVYRDSAGSGEWAILPWDVDLSWGRNWLDSRGYFTDTLYQDNVLNFYNHSQQAKPANRLYNLVFKHPDFRRMYLRRLRTVMDKVLQSPQTPSDELLIEARIRRMMDLMDPPGITLSDADLDYAKWKSWGNNNSMRAEAARIIDTHLPGRRAFLFTNPAATLEGERIPEPQPQDVSIEIGEIDSNPASGNQAEEFIELLNPNSMAVDISGWRLETPVRFVFRPGTVLPAGGRLYLSPDAVAFRARKLAPRGGQGLFVQAPYQGQLSARGGTVHLRDEFGRSVAAKTYASEPTPAQQRLRITELMYNPAPPPGESSFSSQDFEYVELKNIGSAPLALAGIRFVTGIQFDFTASAITSLEPGAYILLVKNALAFQSLYGSHHPIAGEYEGFLDNAGERIQLIDAVGEVILDFTYNDRWRPVTDGLGFSLVVADELADPDFWNSTDNWRASSRIGGSPGGPDALVPPVDSDGDGLPDDWELAHGTDPHRPDANADPDGDGMTNMQEYIAGTDPRDAGSLLRLEILLMHDGSARVRFQARPGRRYTVQRASGLGSGWTDLASFPPASEQVLDAQIQTGADAGFYRLICRWP